MFSEILFTEKLNPLIKMLKRFILVLSIARIATQKFSLLIKHTLMDRLSHSKTSYSLESLSIIQFPIKKENAKLLAIQLIINLLVSTLQQSLLLVFLVILL